MMNRFKTILGMPPVRALLFSLLPLGYYVTGTLNYSQAGKAALLGFLMLTPALYWRELFPASRLVRATLVTAIFLLFLNIVFQAVLRHIFGVQQDDVLVVQALINTNVEETRGFIVQYLRPLAAHLGAAVLLFAGYWFFCVRLSPDRQASGRGERRPWLPAAACVSTVILLVSHVNSSLRKANPLFYISYHYQKAAREMEMARELREDLAGGESAAILGKLSLDSASRRRTVVLVIGESDTRRNWSLYGYGRQTNPELAKLRDRLLVFSDVLAADGSTVGSITRMLTAATAEQPELWKTSPTVMAAARRLGYKVFWLANQGAANRGMVPILASQSDVTVFTNRGMDRGESSFDEVLLEPYRQALDDPAERKLIVVQLLGAHPAYNFRYPEKFSVFEKRIDDEVAEGLRKQGRAPWAILFRNAYDCAILYGDHVLARLLQGLMMKEPSSSVWLYVSDHGQDVAHHSDFSGHNQNAREQWEVPLVLWRSPDSPPLADAALTARPYRNDLLDHTLLGLLGIRGDLYDPELDLLSAQFKSERIMPRKMAGAQYD
ncbi:MAG: phosphoethanolamine transferase [Desulfobulbaceae bacterium]|nr:MAG: phosphoethanolamine transferase [Desulfobulbaceae bacterium]